MANPNRPYFATFQQVIRTVLSYAAIGDKAHFFFGLDRPFAQYATGLYSTLKNNDDHPYKDRFGQISFPLAKETPALQASDFLVQVLYLDTLKYVVKGSNRLIRPSPLIRLLIANFRAKDDLSYQDAALTRETLRTIPIELRGDLLEEELWAE